MKFNTRLLKGIKEEDAPLAEIILFFIERGYNLYHFFPREGGKVVIVDLLYDDVQRVTSKLIENETLIPDYPNDSLVRLSPIHSLYVPDDAELTIDVNRLRSHFPTGQKSDKITVHNMLTEFFKKYPQYSMFNVEAAAVRYISHCKVTDRPIRDCNNFIEDADGVSMLLQWLEETETSIEDEFI